MKTQAKHFPDALEWHCLSNAACLMRPHSFYASDLVRKSIVIVIVIVIVNTMINSNSNSYQLWLHV